MSSTHDSPKRAFLGRAMTPEELEAFTQREPFCRVATINTRGLHVTATGYVWDGSSVWLPSAVSTQRLKDIERDPRMTALVDSSAGPDGGFVEFVGRAEVVGEVPRMGEPHPRLEEVERLLQAKYGISIDMVHDGPGAPMGGHAWIELVPERIISSGGR